MNPLTECFTMFELCETLSKASLFCSCIIPSTGNILSVVQHFIDPDCLASFKTSDLVLNFLKKCAENVCFVFYHTVQG